MIEIRDIHKSFKSQKVLNGVNLKINAGELIAIIGRSGGGKSVLLKHLIGLLKPDAGSILINDEDITVMNSKDLDRIRQKIGVLFQGGALFDSINIFENVAFVLREKTNLTDDVITSKTLQALEDVGLTGMGEKFPAEISGGMKKRAALARALIHEPQIVFFDEPTTGLDPIMINTIHQLIAKTKQKYGFTGVIVSHEIPEIFDIADRVAVLYEGKIIEVGTPSEIVNSDSKVVRHFISGGKQAL